MTTTMTQKRARLLDLAIVVVTLVAGYTIGNMGRQDSVSAVKDAVKEIRTQSATLQRRMDDLEGSLKEEVRRKHAQTKQEVMALSGDGVADALRELLSSSRRDKRD